MNKTELAKLLGRPLTSNESNDCNTYIDIAESKLEELLCTQVKRDSGERIYEVRENYSTVFTDIFISINSVKINGETVSETDYHTSFFNKRNTDHKNSLVFKKKFTQADELTIDAEWGFEPMPKDLAQVMAKLFSQAASGVKNDQLVKSKRVEDFSVTFADNGTTSEEALTNANRLVLNKYSQCNVGYIRSGEVC